MGKTEFAGFPVELIEFLLALKTNNNREWFNSHKGDYKHFFQEPANQFCEGMVQNLRDLTGYEHRSKVFRLHRDLRFSKDKTPYNCHLHISFIPDRVSIATPPSWFFGLEPEKLTVGAGVFGFDKNALDNYRQCVDQEGEGLQLLLDELADQGFRLGDIELKRVPKPFAQDHPNADLLKRKGLSAWYDFPGPAVANQPEMSAQCLAQFARLKSLFAWLLKLE